MTEEIGFILTNKQSDTCSSLREHHLLSVPTLSNRCQHSLALVVLLAWCLLNRDYRTRRRSVALGFWSLCDFGGLGRFRRWQLFFYPPMFLFLYLFLLFLVLLLLLLLGFDDGALGECSELLVYGF